MMICGWCELPDGTSTTSQKHWEFPCYSVRLPCEESDSVRYIYHFGDDTKKLAVVVRRRKGEGLRFAINPAFWGGLDIRTN